MKVDLSKVKEDTSSYEEDERPIPFGKYKGKSASFVAEFDPSYIVWLYEIPTNGIVSKALYESCCREVAEGEAEHELDLNGRDDGPEPEAVDHFMRRH